MGLKVSKLYDPVGGCYYKLDMGLLIHYTLTFGTTMAGYDPENMWSIRVHGKDLRGAYKQQGRCRMDEWNGE